MFNFLNKQKEPENFKEVLEKFQKLEKEFLKVSQELESLQKKTELHIQKIGVVRFNPFSEVGSDQSFSLALLDAKDSGVVITSLYTREENRVYGKPIKNGESQYSLSDEEREAINKAKEKNTNNAE